MAVDYFLKIDGIPGESQDSKHKDEIQLESWSWGESQSGTMAYGGGGGAGKVDMQDFHFVMTVNKATPKLILACASGEHIKKAVLTCRKAGKTQQEFLIYNFSDVLVSSYQTGGGRGDVGSSGSPASRGRSRARSNTGSRTGQRRSPTRCGMPAASTREGGPVRRHVRQRLDPGLRARGPPRGPAPSRPRTRGGSLPRSRAEYAPSREGHGGPPSPPGSRSSSSSTCSPSALAIGPPLFFGAAVAPSRLPHPSDAGHGGAPPEPDPDPRAAGSLEAELRVLLPDVLADSAAGPRRRGSSALPLTRAPILGMIAAVVIEKLLIPPIDRIRAEAPGPDRQPARRRTRAACSSPDTTASRPSLLRRRDRRRVVVLVVTARLFAARPLAARAAARPPVPKLLDLGRRRPRAATSLPSRSCSTWSDVRAAARRLALRLGRHLSAGPRRPSPSHR